MRLAFSMVACSRKELKARDEVAMEFFLRSVTTGVFGLQHVLGVLV